jgi:hypothetical protein
VVGLISKRALRVDTERAVGYSWRLRCSTKPYRVHLHLVLVSYFWVNDGHTEWKLQPI